MQFKNSFRFKIGIGITVLILGVGSLLAANGINDIEVKDSEGGKISVEFKDADVQDVFRVLSLKGNVNIVSDPEVKGLVTVQISDVSKSKSDSCLC